MPNSSSSITVGRSRDCDLVLADASVSRRHAELRMLADGTVQVTDLGSTRGTAVLRRGKVVPIVSGIVERAETLRFGDAEIAVADVLAVLSDHSQPLSNGAPRSLVRCDCGAVKQKGSPCKECGK
jgi:pSer/pThr/pTyr-binding forkhead associated (FHA) protein